MIVRACLACGHRVDVEIECPCCGASLLHDSAIERVEILSPAAALGLRYVTAATLTPADIEQIRAATLDGGLLYDCDVATGTWATPEQMSDARVRLAAAWNSRWGRVDAARGERAA